MGAPTTFCDFCDKPASQVGSIIVGNRFEGGNRAVAICSECVDLCVEIFKERALAATTEKERDQ